MSNKIIAVNNSTDASELAGLATDPAVTLDVTKLDLGRLPEHVKAALYTEATSFNAPQLQTSGNIYARAATNFSAPQLQASGNIYADRATSCASTKSARWLSA